MTYIIENNEIIWSLDKYLGIKLSSTINQAKLVRKNKLYLTRYNPVKN